MLTRFLTVWTDNLYIFYLIPGVITATIQLLVLGCLYFVCWLYFTILWLCSLVLHLSQLRLWCCNSVSTLKKLRMHLNNFSRVKFYSVLKYVFICRKFALFWALESVSIESSIFQKPDSGNEVAVVLSGIKLDHRWNWLENLCFQQWAWRHFSFLRCLLFFY